MKNPGSPKKLDSAESVVDEIPSAIGRGGIGEEQVSSPIAQGAVDKVAINILDVVEDYDFITYGPVSYHFHRLHLKRLSK
jgi:hypothetical protein